MAFSRAGAASALGAGLRGIGRAVTDKRREEEERERQQMYDDWMIEDREMAAEDRALGRELDFIDMGGRVGEVPTVDREIMGTGSPRPEFDPGPLVPEPRERTPIGADDFLGDASLDVPEREPVRISEPDENFISVGPGYIEDPERREARIEQERIDRFRKRLAPGISGLASGDIDRDSPNFGETTAGLLAEGVDPTGFYRDPIQDPEVPQWRQQFDAATGAGVSAREYFLGREPMAAGGGATRDMTMSQAMDLVNKETAIYDDAGYEVGHRLPMEDRINMAREIVSGGTPSFGGESETDLDIPEPGTERDEGRIDLPRPSNADLAAELEGGRQRGGGQGLGGRIEGWLGENFGRDARERRSEEQGWALDVQSRLRESGLPREEWEDELRASGYSTEEIQRIFRYSEPLTQEDRIERQRLMEQGAGWR